MKMRAKFRITNVDPATEKNGMCEVLTMSAVGGSKVQGGYPDDGSDEDNTFAKWTPSAELQMTITNPALHGQYKRDQKFYVDFTPAE